LARRRDEAEIEDEDEDDVRDRDPFRKNPAQRHKCGFAGEFANSSVTRSVTVTDDPAQNGNKGNEEWESRLRLGLGLGLRFNGLEGDPPLGCWTGKTGKEAHEHWSECMFRTGKVPVRSAKGPVRTRIRELERKGESLTEANKLTKKATRL